MPSFGEGLKKERESRGITLDQVSISTKVSTRLLRALEEEQFDQLPGGVFNRGFVRAYSSYLGLDAQTWVAAYMEAAGEERPPQQDVLVQSTSSFGEELAGWLSGLPWGSLGLALLLILLAGALWMYKRKHDTPKPPAAAISQAASPNPAPVQSTATLANPIVPPATSTAGELIPVSVPTPVATIAVTPAAKEDHPGQFSVLVQARARCWILETHDGQTSEAILNRGGQQLIHASKVIAVKVGNAGGVTLAFNGKPVPVEATPGGVRIYRFTPSGLAETQ